MIDIEEQIGEVDDCIYEVEKLAKYMKAKRDKLDKYGKHVDHFEEALYKLSNCLHELRRANDVLEDQLPDED